MRKRILQLSYLCLGIGLLHLPLAVYATTTGVEDLGYFSSTNEGEVVGSTMTNIGDVNGDGYEDIAIGAPGYSGDRGAIYIVYGRAKEYTAVDLSSQARLVGENENDRIGYSVAAVGDINNDSFADFAFGTIYEDSEAKNAGAMYIAYGQAEQLSGEMQISSLPKYTGSNSRNKFGSAIAGGGDINGDGFDDVIVGAHRFGNKRSGHVYILYGQADPYGGGEISDVDDFFVGESNYDEAGTSVAMAGDINNDGLDDIIIGAPGSDITDDNAGAVYILYGQASAFGEVSLANANVRIAGETAGEAAGYVVAAAGDMNSDNYADVLMSAPYSNADASEGGIVYLLYGSDTLTNSTVNDHIQFTGDKDDDFAGYSIAGNADANTDGYDDIIIGAPSGSGSRSGIVVIIYGKAEILSGGPIRNYEIYQGEKRQHEAGTDVDFIDVDGDASAEILIGAPHYGVVADESGRAYIGYLPVITCDNSAELGGIMADYPKLDWKHRNYKKNSDLRIVVEKKGTSAYLVNCETDEVLQEMQFNNHVQRKILARVFTKRSKPLFVAVTRTPNKRSIKIFLYKQKETSLEQTDYVKRRWRPRGLRINVNNYRNQIRLYKGKEEKHLVVYRVTSELQLERVADN